MVKRLPTMWETQVQSLGWEDPLDKEMATHSSILAWKIPWMEEPGRLHSMGSQRVGHDWATYIILHPHHGCIGEGNGTPLQYSCLENPVDGGVWWAAVPGVAKSRTRLSDFTFTFHFHALEKEMATHSSVLAWRIPATGEPGRLLSMGSHRVGCDWSDAAAAAAAAAGMYGCSNFSISLLALISVPLLSPVFLVDLESISWFWFVLPQGLMMLMLRLLLYNFWPLLWRNAIQIICPYFNWVIWLFVIELQKFFICPRCRSLPDIIIHGSFFK